MNTSVHHTNDISKLADVLAVETTPETGAGTGQKDWASGLLGFQLLLASLGSDWPTAYVSEFN